MNNEDKPSPWGPRPTNRPHNQPHKPGGPKRPPPSSNNNRPKSRFSIFLVGIIVILFVILVINWLMPGDGFTDNATGGLLYDGILLAFVGAGLWVHVRSSPGIALRHMATWVIIFGLLALGYSIWSGTGRLAGELNTANGFAEKGSISFQADMSGHYFVRAEVNGVKINFMVDTGATDVALTKGDARKIGLQVDQLRYNMPYNTANGVTYGAPVRLDNIRIGPIYVQNVSGSIVPQGLDHSLLGMSFLKRLSGYKVVDGVLTLYPQNPT